MLQYAAHAIATGQANVVACLYADAPLREGGSISQSGYSGRRFDAPGLAGLRFAYGDYGPANSGYAMALRRHMHLFGTTHEQLGTIAVGQRAWAQMNPHAQMRKPMTHRRLPRLPLGRGAAAPLRLLPGLQRRRRRDRHLGASGRATCASRRCTCAASASARPATPARGERDPAHPHGRRRRPGQLALRQAGIELADVDVLELYDCYTYTVLVTLEDYGFCAKGEGGDFVADGRLGPGGALPCNTGGGQLSSYYMWGFTPLSEGVIQARGQARRAAGRQARPRPRLRQRRRPDVPLHDDPQPARGRRLT